MSTRVHHISTTWPVILGSSIFQVPRLVVLRWIPMVATSGLTRTTCTLMYVYNDNDFNPDLDVSAESWVALTSNKRAYDYLAVRQAANADDIVLTIPDHDTPTVNFFGETLMYFNTTDMDLKIRQKVLTAPMAGSAPEEYVNWVSISQRSLNPIDDHDADPDFHDIEPHPALRQLETEY